LAAKKPTNEKAVNKQLTASYQVSKVSPSAALNGLPTVRISK
jgi:hypothetical protein